MTAAETTWVTENRRDFVRPFSIEGRGVRGRMTRLETSLNEILSARDYPAVVSFLLAEAVSVTALLGSMLKTNGVMTFQINSEGPVRLLFADFATPGQLRAYARFDEAAVAARDTIETDRLVPRLLKAGTLSVTMDPEGAKERYQGITDLEGASLAACMEAYFRQSEQLPTVLRTATDYCFDPETSVGTWRSSAVMVQPLPGNFGPGQKSDSEFYSQKAEDDWRHAVIMTSSVTDRELLDTGLSAEAVLYRLYHEDGVRVFEPTTLRFRCRCSAEKVRDILARFSAEERAEMTVNGQIEATCEICGRIYYFRPGSIDS